MLAWKHSFAERKYKHTGMQGMNESFSEWKDLYSCWDCNVVDKDGVHVSDGLLITLLVLLTNKYSCQ